MTEYRKIPGIRNDLPSEIKIALSDAYDPNAPLAERLVAMVERAQQLRDEDGDPEDKIQPILGRLLQQIADDRLRREASREGSDLTQISDEAFACAAEKIYIKTMRDYGEEDLANLFIEDHTAFERLCTAGRQSGPAGA